jgi:hypothetical protein
MQYNILIYLGKNLLLPAWRRKFYVYLLILFFIYVASLYLGYLNLNQLQTAQNASHPLTGADAFFMCL